MREYNWFAVGLLTSLLAVLPGCGGGGGGNGEMAPSVPTGLTLTPQSIKTFRFEWQDSDGETEYRLMENPDGVSGYAEVATLPADSTEHELTVSLPGRINARYALLACNDAGCRDSDPVFVNTNLAEAVGYFKASDTGADDNFGSSVAISADGRTLAVGARGEGDAEGAVYVFTHANGQWSQQVKVKASNHEAVDVFGQSVSLSDNGDTLAVGAYGEASNATGTDITNDQSNNDLNFSGAVYVFTRANGQWSQQAYVKASNTGAGDFFGFSVSLSGDGDTLAVGAYGEASNATGTGITNDQSNNDRNFSGAVYVFTRANGMWSQQAYVKASNTGTEDVFGFSVSLSGDGDTLAVGAYGEASDATGVDNDQSNDDLLDSGAAYVFTRTNGTWSQQAYIKASNTGNATTGNGDNFGESVSLSGDGDTLAVGAPDEDSNATGVGNDENNDDLPDSGAAYVFTRANGTWSQQAYIKASNTGNATAGDGDNFGESVSLSGDGDTLAVGAPEEDSGATGIDGFDGDTRGADNSGAVYLFTRTNGNWSQQAYIKASNSDNDDNFGRDAAISGDGSILAVGADEEDTLATGINGDQDNEDADEAGAVYLY